MKQSRRSSRFLASVTQKLAHFPNLKIRVGTQFKKSRYVISFSSVRIRETASELKRITFQISFARRSVKENFETHWYKKWEIRRMSTVGGGKQISFKWRSFISYFSSFSSWIWRQQVRVFKCFWKYFCFVSVGPFGAALVGLVKYRSGFLFVQGVAEVARVFTTEKLRHRFGVAASFAGTLYNQLSDFLPISSPDRSEETIREVLDWECQFKNAYCRSACFRLSTSLYRERAEWRDAFLILASSF